MGRNQRKVSEFRARSGIESYRASGAGRQAYAV